MFLRVAGWQAPLSPMDPSTAVARIREQVDQCEADDVHVLCCPETILGGLGDFSAHPEMYALDTGNGELATILAPLHSATVAVIVGFTERTRDNVLFNSAAVLHGGAIAGIYRKNHPAIRRSIYRAGKEQPVFRLGQFTFGVLICNDSNSPELAALLVAKGAQILFVPSNNGLPHGRGDVVRETRMADTRMAQAHHVPVVRADVAGRTGMFEAYGTSAITSADGVIVKKATPFTSELLIGDVRIGGMHPSEDSGAGR